jgi:hypothetical protein
MNEMVTLHTTEELEASNERRTICIAEEKGQAI